MDTPRERPLAFRVPAVMVRKEVRVLFQPELVPPETAAALSAAEDPNLRKVVKSSSGRTTAEIAYLTVPIKEVPVFVHSGRVVRPGVTRCSAAVVAAALLVPIRRVIRLLVADLPQQRFNPPLVASESKRKGLPAMHTRNNPAEFLGQLLVAQAPANGHPFVVRNGKGVTHVAEVGKVAGYTSTGQEFARKAGLLGEVGWYQRKVLQQLHKVDGHKVTTARLRETEVEPLTGPITPTK